MLIMIKNIRLLTLLCLGLLCPLVASAESALELPAIFSDQMVLQADKPAPIWGQARPGAKVAVTLDGLSAQGTSDEKGNWRVELPAGPAGGPWDLIVESDSEKLVIKDVLRGEVWLCSGQSNMAMAFHALPNYAEVVAQANDPQLRYFSARPVQPRSEKQSNLPGKWSDVTPKSMHSFSAVPYFFGRKIREATGKPVGLIISTVGGTPIESWTDLETMEANPAFEASLERFAQAKAEFPARMREFERELAQWEIQANEAKGKGEPPPRKPRMPIGDNHMNAPANLYNGMIYPLVGYGIRGILWYQGEANAGIDAAIYAEQFPAMIQNWRQAWGKPELPFYFVQLPNYRVGLKPWAVLRESQRKALQLPHTGMAVTIDVGDVAELHPENKLDVGERLARWALKNEYGKEIVPSGPLVRKADFHDGKVIIHFDYATGLKTSNGEAPQTFEVAGPDGKFVPVSATIQEETIVIEPPGQEPVQTIRYGWDSSPPVNLVNSENLPASPFAIEVTHHSDL
jgi:sialate O-acetylesterase